MANYVKLLPLKLKMDHKVYSRIYLWLLGKNVGNIFDLFLFCFVFEAR